MKVKREMLGWIVAEASDDGQIEQALCLDFGDEYPIDGVLGWRGTNEKATVFRAKATARAAIKRTEHYRIAFDDHNRPEAKWCKLVPVEYAAKNQ